MKRDPHWDKPEPAVPKRQFETWLREQMAEQDADDVAQLVDQGWPEVDAIAFVMENPREGT